MHMERLAAFRAVAREQSFSRAASRLFKTQPAVSQAVGSLEQELGERLFLRLGRRTELTASGRVFLEHVEQAFDALARGRAELEALGELREGELSIGTSDTTACYVLPPVLRAFRERHPGVELRISNRPSPRTAEQVTSREVDLGFVTLPVERRGLRVEPLVEREDVAICAPGHELAVRRRVRLDTLVRHPLLLLDRGSSTRSFIDARLRGVGEPFRVAMELGSIEVIKQLVGLDFGVSIVPRIAVEAELAAGSLHAMRLFPRSDWRSLGAITPSSGPLPRAAEVFLELARGVLARRAGRRPESEGPSGPQPRAAAEEPAEPDRARSARRRSRSRR